LLKSWASIDKKGILIYTLQIYITWRAFMIRTQIYLTREEQKGLKTLAALSGKKQSALIREALDNFLSSEDRSKRSLLLQKGKGLWERRSDLPDFQAIRNELDARLS